MNQTSSPVSAGSIVVGIDGSEHATVALDWAVDQALLEHRPLTVAYAAPSHVASYGAVREAERRALRRDPGLEVHAVVRVADAIPLLTELGRGAAMVVVGSHGRGPVRSRLLGSVGLSLAKHPSCPVVVHRPWHPGRVRRGVLAGLDDSERSMAVAEAAYRLASLRRLPLRLVHCEAEVPVALMAASGYVPATADLEAERAALAEVVAGLAEKYPDVRARTEVVTGDPTAVLARESIHHDALVVGRHHGGPVTTALSGSVTAEVVERARCPVLVVPLG